MRLITPIKGLNADRAAVPPVNVYSREVCSLGANSMNLNSRASWSWLLKAGAAASCAYGIYLHISAHGTGFIAARTVFYYYTTQSNLWFGMIAVLFLLLQFSGRPPAAIPQWLYIVKFCLTAAIALTFVGFSLLLAPFMPRSYLLSMSNVTLHYATPILAVLDFAAADRHYRPRRVHLAFSIIMPLLYLCTAMTLSLRGVAFGRRNVPYFFLDYERFGWFAIGRQGIGVVYWLLLITGMMVGLAYLLQRLHAHRYNQNGANISQ